MRRCTARLVAWGLVLCAVGAHGEEASILAPLVDPDGRLSAAWTFMGLPDQTVARTQFDVVHDAGGPAVQVTARQSYGGLLQSLAPPARAGTLRWRWRARRLNDAADLRTRHGDDLSLKVCVMFDLPLRAVPRVERWLLRLARLRSGLALPAATLCYGWDHRLPAGTLIENVYSRRVRTLILRRGLDAPPRWQPEQRNLTEDFRAAFGDEAPVEMPAVTAVAIGADTDNSGGSSAGEIADLELAPETGDR